jgi:hypothetical protein
MRMSQGPCVAIVCLAVLAGCSARAGQASVSPLLREPSRSSAPEASEDSKSSADAAGSTNARSLAGLPQERMVIKSANLVVNVRDVASAYARAVQLAEASGGYVQASTQSQEDGEQAHVTIRVPPNGFLPLIASLEDLGAPRTKTISGEDVTQEYYDLDGELQSQMEVRSRLFQLLAKAAKVQDAIEVETQLERIGANVNRIKGRMKYLETMTGLSTISLTLSSDARPSAGGFIDWSSIGRGFFRAAQILVQVFFVVLQVLVVALPLAVVVGVIAWCAVLLARFARKKRAPKRR